MVDFIVGILNSIGSGVGDDLVADLLKTPAEYNAGMYRLSLTIAGTAVKPIASTILVAKAPGPMAADPGDLPWTRLPPTMALRP